jgi:hypothetical protein
VSSSGVHEEPEPVSVSSTGDPDPWARYDPMARQVPDASHDTPLKPGFGAVGEAFAGSGGVTGVHGAPGEVDTRRDPPPVLTQAPAALHDTPASFGVAGTTSVDQ